MIKLSLVFLVFCCFSVVSIDAQQKPPNADSLFLKAREAAFSDRWAEARQMSRELLSHYPDYYDATMLIGRTYAWEHKADSARMTVMPLLEVEPDSYDVLMLLTDNEIWSENYDAAIRMIDRALLFYPRDEDFLFKRANAFYLNGFMHDAEIAAQTVLEVNPNHVGAQELIRQIQAPRIAERQSEAYDLAEAATRARNYGEAQKHLRQLLAEEPDHFAASLLMAQTYAFENKFDSARHVTRELHRAEPENYDLLELMINIEIWDKEYKTAMTRVNTALAAYPDDPDFLYKKALIQFLQKDYDDALDTLNHLLDDIDPTHAEAIALRDLILQNYRYRDYVLHEHYFEYAKNRPPSGYYTRKWIASAGLAKWTKHGTYIGKLNVGHDWDKNHRNLVNATRAKADKNPLPAYQIELEAYQNLWSTAYLWLNHAFRVPMQNSRFFPRHRGGIELFQRIPENFEGSIGCRYMVWEGVLKDENGDSVRNEDGEEVPDINSSLWSWVGTLSISWVPNRNYFAYRAFIGFTDWGLTHIFTYRRYFSDHRPEYFYALAGYGSYSDEFLYFDRNPSMTFLWQVGIHKFISPRWFFLAAAGATHDSGQQDRWMAQAGIRYYFKLF